MQTKETIFKSISFVLIFGAAAIIAGAQTINIQQQNDYTTGNAAQAPILAVGDVNNDRLPDLVVLNKSNTTTVGPIAVFLNNGAGGFAAPINIVDTALSPNVAIIGDFNRDGNPDLALANDGIGNGVQIRLGNGTGNFPTGTFLATERGIFGMVSADFNGDGNLDLAGFGNSNDLRVFNGNGTGGFSAATPYTLSFGASDIIVADFNIDGKPDLAVAAPNSALINIFLNNGAGVFTAAPNITGIGNPNKIVAADFNRDCLPDLAMSAASTGNVVRILLGNGAGGFAAQPTVAVTNQPTDVSVGDFNRDKKVDLAIRRITSTAGVPNFTILPGNGAGGFGTAFELTLPITGAFAFSHSLATIDANTDGKADILISRQGGFFLYHGNSALFTRTENDFDGDLRADMSVFRPSNGTWYVNRSTKGLAVQQWGIAADKLAPADYDGDGKTDIAVWREGIPSVAAFYILNSSSNTFRTEQFGQTGDEPAVVSDWDGDGKADPTVYRNTAAANQNFFYYRGSLNNPTGATTYLAWGTTGDKAVRGDFDGDGKADAAVFRPSNAVWYILQSSNGQTLYRTWGAATDKRVTADYDGDGKTDLAVFRPSDNFWYISNSAGGTSSFRQWGASSDALVPADYNGDGRTEIAAYRGGEGNWYIPQCGVDGQVVQKFGAAGDAPVPSAVNP